MLFHGYPHYDLDDINFCLYEESNTSDLAVCVICYDEMGSLLELQDQRIYITDCMCKAFIHKNCLLQWLNVNPKCPICRIAVVQTTSKYRPNQGWVFGFVLHFCQIFWFLYLLSALSQFKPVPT